MSKETGGPAFPHHVVCDNGWAETQILQGMTLRDYFAAKAMQGRIINNDNNGDIPHDWIAVDAYRYADAMLKAREQ